MNAADILRHRIAPAALDRITALGFPPFLGSFPGAHFLPHRIRQLPAYLWIDLSQGPGAGCASVNPGRIAEILGAEVDRDPDGHAIAIDDIADAAHRIAATVEASVLRTIREISADERAALFATKH